MSDEHGTKLKVRISFGRKLLMLIVITIIASSMYIYSYIKGQEQLKIDEQNTLIRNMMIWELTNRLCTFRMQIETGDPTHVYGFSEIGKIVLDINTTSTPPRNIIHWYARCYNLGNITDTVYYIFEADVNSANVKAQRLQILLNQSENISEIFNETGE